jgi:hypothetical protein
MMHSINRRGFLAAAAGTSALAAFSGFPTLALARGHRRDPVLTRIADDRFELVHDGSGPFRILQLTDTHFGRPKDGDKAKDEKSRVLIRTLIDENQPSMAFHTGDFINNDMDGVEHSAIGFMNDLGIPWSVVFGNHDHGPATGSLTMEDYYAKFQNHAVGFIKVPEHEAADGVKTTREYCFRIDVRAKDAPAPGFTLIGFNCGKRKPALHVPESQMAWMKAQLEADAKLGRTHPIIVMQHVPTVDFKTLYDSGKATGRKGEDVCFESDTGAVLDAYSASKRVRAVFVGHDHVNDYIGEQKGVKLVYGRVSGWAGYGDWQRGGRTIDLDLTKGTMKTRVVLPRGVSDEKPEWNVTREEA